MAPARQTIPCDWPETLGDMLNGILNLKLNNKQGELLSHQLTAERPAAREAAANLTMSNSLEQWMSRKEPYLVAIFALLLLAVNLGTGVLYPTSWMDEAMFSDPAINLIQGKGWTSTAWWQSKSVTWSGNVPLYTVCIVPWMKVFGTDLINVRSFNYTVISVTMLVFWLAIKRLGWVQSATARVSMLMVAFLSVPLFFPYRCARPDCLGILLCAIALLLWSVQTPKAKYLGLLAVGFFVPTSGLQLICYFGFLCVLCFAMEGKRAIPSLLSLGAGMVIGASVLVAYYSANHLTGVLETIKVAKSLRMDEAGGVNASTGFQEKVIIKTKRILSHQLLDYGIMPALMIAAVLASDRSVWSNRRRRFLILIAVVSSMGIVSALELFMHYLPYYHWMNYSILILICFVLLSQVWSSLGRLKQAIVVMILCGSVMAGMPLRLFLGVAFGQRNEYAEYKQLVAKEISNKDVIFSEFMGYFPLKAKAGEVYSPPYLRVMSPEEKQSINVLVVDTIHLEWYSKMFSAEGQKWKKVGSVSAHRSSLGDLVRRVFPNYTTQPTSCGYSVVILRRES